MARSIGNLAVKMSLNSGKFTKGMRNARRSVGGFRKSIVGTIGKLAVLGAAFTAMAAIFKKGVRLAAEQEKAEKKLAAALRLTGDSSARSLERMKDFASGIQRVTTLGDEAVLELAALGASMGKLSGKALQDATKSAIGLSRAFGIELVGAMRLVSRAAVGDFGTLTRYGIVLDATGTKQEKFNELLKIGAKNFTLATAEIETAAGQMSQIFAVLGDIMEKVFDRVNQAFKDNFGASVLEMFRTIDKWLAKPKKLPGGVPVIDAILGRGDKKSQKAELDRFIAARQRLIDQLTKQAADLAKSPLPPTRFREGRFLFAGLRAELRTIRTPLNRPADERAEALRGIAQNIANVEERLRIARQEASRLKSLLTVELRESVQKFLFTDIPKGAADLFGVALEKVKALDERIAAFQKRTVAAGKALRIRAEAVRDLIRTPAERLAIELKKIKELLDKGRLTPAEFGARKKQLLDELFPAIEARPLSATAARLPEAITTLSGALVAVERAGKRSEAERTAREQLKMQRDMRDSLIEIAENTSEENEPNVVGIP